MSSIASFFLVPEERLPALRALAGESIQIGKPGLLGPGKSATRDPWWEYLREHATELERFNWSGSVMWAVERYLDARRVRLRAFADEAVTGPLSSARGTDILVFHAEAAGRLAQSLVGLRPSPATAASFVAQDSGHPNELQAQALLAGFGTLRRWLAAVGGRQCGLLIIG